jgi:hypothetical protein
MSINFLKVTLGARRVCQKIENFLKNKVNSINKQTKPKQTNPSI